MEITTEAHERSIKSHDSQKIKDSVSSSNMVFFYIVVVCTFVLMFWLCLYLFEVNNGPKLDEQVTVKRRHFNPGGVVYTGETMLPSPRTYSLFVANKNGNGMVRVSQAMYESVSEGDTIRVKGTRGRSSSKWYLKEAHKETKGAAANFDTPILKI